MADLKQPTDKLQTYLDAISSYEREYKKWESRVEKIHKRYRDDRGSKGTEKKKFNSLWANTQTLVPACFSKLPKPDVTRRFRDSDPVGRVGALILERALDFEVQHYSDFKTAMQSAVRARFLGGRGQAWARYEPHFSTPAGEPTNGLQVTEDADDIQVQEQLDYECAPVDYVNYRDFGHSVARTWEEVPLTWRVVYMGEKAFRQRFPEKKFPKLYKNGKPVVPFDATPTEEMKSAQRSQENPKKQAKIYEVADKDAGVFVWVSKSHSEILDERPDPLKLQEFFPCPKPLYATLTEDSLVPVPDFTLYQDQADSLDTLADRIAGLVDMLQLKGVYDAAADSSLGRLFTEGSNGTLLPVKNWAAFAEKNGLQGQIDVVDLTPLANALKSAVEAFAQKKAEMDEISGVIDVIRGEVDPQEKLGQTQMKGQYANLRLRDKQQDVAEFATGLLRLKAQIICGKFNPKTILAMAAVDQLTPEDQQLVPQALELLVGPERMNDPTADGLNPLRSFRIEVAADTLVQIDEDAEKASAKEFLEGVGTFLDLAAKVGTVAPPMIPLLLELLKWAVTRFKVGKQIEGTIDSTVEQLKQMASQPQGVPPEVQEEIQKVQEEQMKKDEELKKREAEAFQKETQHQVERIQFDADKQVYEAQKKADQKMMQGEQKMAQDRMGMDQEHSGRMMELDGREQEMNLRETATKAAGDLEGKLATAEERVSTADVIRKEQESRSGEVKGALTEVSEALQAVKQVLQDLVKVSRADRVAVRGPDGRVAGSKVAG